MSKLCYFDLLSPLPIAVEGLGRIKSPTLLDISKLGYRTYHTYLGMLAAELPTHLKDLHLCMFDLLVQDKGLREMFTSIFSFFICGEITYLKKQEAFLIKEDGVLCGHITRENFASTVDHCLQLNYIRLHSQEEEKYANEKARLIAEKMKEAKEKQNKKNNKKNNKDEDLEISNMISVLAAFHQSLNIASIWNVTIFQLYDQFFRQNYKNQMDIHAMNYAMWGGEFHPSDWFKNLLDT